MSRPSGKAGGSTPSTHLGGQTIPRQRTRLIYRGAEADIMLGDWSGLKAVFKVRKPLAYRNPSLDSGIRRQRTLHEAEIIHEAKKAGVSSPILYDVSAPDATLVMEYVEGTRLRELARRGNGDALGLFRRFGERSGSLHNSGLVHGDLTTANVICRDSEPVFLDFGLAMHSRKVEDHAVDLRLIKETVTAAHPGISGPALEEFMEGYTKEVGPARARSVFTQLRNIERRGRYARVV